MKTWPIDPLGLRNVQLEVTKKSPAESTKCSPLGAVCGTLFGRQSGPRMGPMQQKCLCRRAPNAVPERVPQIASIARPLRRLPTGRDGTGRDGTGRDGTGRDFITQLESTLLYSTLLYVIYSTLLYSTLLYSTRLDSTRP